jgi:hypothetical protein
MAYYLDETEQNKANAREEKRQESLADPFDKRSEVTADARYIVKHLWVIAVGIPVVVGVAIAFMR